MLISYCRLAFAGALLTVVLALPSAATADVFDPLAPAQIQSGPSITTDKADYEPGSPVLLTGSGWQAGESIDIVVNDDGLQSEPWQHTATVVADATGAFEYLFDLPDVVVANYTLTATGASSGTASAAFTDVHTERGCGVSPTLSVNTNLDDFSLIDNGLCSLREAIVTSNAHPEVDEINLDAAISTYTLTIPKDASNEDGEDGDLDVSESVSINGDGAGTDIVEAGIAPGIGVDRVFHVRTTGTTLELNDFTVRHGFANTAGGGIRVEGGSIAAPNGLDLEDMVLTLNRLTSGNGGAGVYVEGFNVDTAVDNSTFTDNDTASNCTGCDGGAIFNRGRSLDIDDSHLDSNSAGAKAGALWNNNGGQVTIDDSTLNDNTNNNAGADDLDGFGGAIYQADPDSNMTITNSEVNGNTSQGRGGGIYITNGRIVIDNSEVNGNTLDGPRDGGGIYSSSALESPPAVQIIDSTVADNTTGRSGGGYFDNMGTNHHPLLIKQSEISGNTAGINGGGIQTFTNATIANSTITNNEAGADVDDPGKGGGIYAKDKTVDVYNATISHNEADGDGDGLRRDGGAANDGVFNLRNTIVANNDDGGSAENCSTETNDNNDVGDAFLNTTHNLEGPSPTGTTCAFGSANGSQSNADADLGPLQNNGGPTFTRAISTSSDALDAADDPTCAAAPVDGIDQRHVPRPQGPHCDVGAYELAATIRGMKFEDLDPVGTKDVTDPGLEGWTINAYADNGEGADDPEDGVIGPDEAALGPAASGETDANGEYALGLSVNPVNDYVICEELQPGWTQTFPDPGTGDCDEVAGAGDEGHRETDLAVGDDFDERDFGNVHSAATVSGMKFRDVDGSGGDFDDTDVPPDEPVEGWVIDAYADDGDGIVDSTEDDTVAATATTASDGSYTLTLAAGDYVICETLPADWVQSFPGSGDGDCSGVADHADNGYAVTVASGDAVADKNFGNIAGLVKGQKTDGTDGLPGWTICAYDDDGVPPGELDDTEVAPPVACAVTDADGNYTLGLQAGDYVICEDLQGGFTQVSPANTKCQELANPAADGGHFIEDLLTSQTRTGNDFENTEEDDTNTISGEKFRDVDSSGTKNAGDEPVENWVINVFTDDGDGTLDDGTEATDPPAYTATTAADGTYSVDVAPGDYVVCEELKDDWEQSFPNPGTSDCSLVDGAGPYGYAVSVPNAGDDSEDNDFGNIAGLVSGLKFNDENEDHVNDADPDDPPLPNWEIRAYADDGDGVLDATEAAAAPVATEFTSDPEGTYTIGLQAGDYVICEMLQTFWIQSFPNPGDGDCSNVDGAGPEGYFIDDLETTDHFEDKHFGNFKGATISGLKFDDQEDPKGTQDAGDPGLEGFTIEAYADGGGGVATGSPIASDVTDADGNYTLTVPADTPAIDYVICEQLPTGWVQSYPDPGDGDCSGVSDATEGHTASVEVEDEVTDKDFGNYRTATVTVNKTYSDGTTTTPVTVKLECTSGDVSPATDIASPGSPAEFDVEQFADGATCDVTEVSDVDGFTPDTSDCEDLELEPGAELECTIENIQEATIVTNGGCTFDRVSDRAGFQFPAIFTPQTGSYYKLSSTNPGQFYLNVVYSGEEDDDIAITIPFPFVTVSPSAIDVHEDVTAGPNGSGRMCFHPKGMLLSKESDSVTWDYGAGGDTFGDTQTIHVTAPEDGLVYVRIHLGYGLKGVAGMCTKGSGTPPPADCTSPANHHFDGYEPYLFTFSGPNDDGGGTVESFNVFKKNPGIGSLALRTTSGDAVPFTNIEYWLGSTKMGTLATDEDGWSMWTYKYTGKAATFTVKIPSYGLSKSVTMKSNGYVAVSFSIADGAVPITPTPTPTPTPSPTPTKPGGKK